MNLLKPVTLLTSTLLLISGCASVAPSSEEPDTADAPPVAEQARLEPLPSYTLDGEGFYNLLMGELALAQDNQEVGLYLLGEAQAQYPLDVRILERVAPLAAQLGDLELALRYFNQWTGASPRDTDAWHGVWQLALTDQDTDLAIHALEELLALSPGYGIYTPFELLAEWSVDDLTVFADDIQASALPVDTNPDVQVILGYLAELRGDRAEADRHWRALAGMMSGQRDYSSFGQLLNELNASSGARVLLSDAVERYPEETRYHTLIARSYLMEDNMRSALEALQYGLDYSPEDAELLRFAGELAFDLQDPEAEDYFTRLLDTPEDDAGYYYLGRLAKERGDYETAFERYQQVDDREWVLGAVQQIVDMLNASALPNVRTQALFTDQRERFPDLMVELAELQGRYWFDHQEYQRAFDTYSLGLREAPDDINLLYMRALSAEALDRIDDTEADLRLILEQDPNNTAALNALGYTLIDRTDRIDEAATMIEQAYQQNPDSAAITDSLGWLRFKQGEYGEAATIFEEALDKQGWDINDDEIITHYVEALWRAGQESQALSVAERWLERHADSPRLNDLLDRLDTQSE